MSILFALLAGITFGAGLTLGDMVNPARVQNFLDVAGHWDPTLLFVMAGGLGVTALGYRVILRRSSPAFADRFFLPTRRGVDRSLVGGAALFGVGWGLAGICPGPAFTDLATLESRVFGFVAAMLAGMLLASVWRSRRAPAAPALRAGADTSSD